MVCTIENGERHVQFVLFSWTEECDGILSMQKKDEDYVEFT